MEIHTLEKNKMDVVRALAETSVKVSEARALLESMKTDQAKFVAERELKALEAVDKALTESKTTLDQASNNYEEAKVLLASISGFSDYLKDAHLEFKKLITSFKERSDLWDFMAKERENIADEQKKQLLIGTAKLSAERESIEQQKKAVERDKAKIKDDRETIERAITRLKEGKI